MYQSKLKHLGFKLVKQNLIILLRWEVDAKEMEERLKEDVSYNSFCISVLEEIDFTSISLNSQTTSQLWKTRLRLSARKRLKNWRKVERAQRSLQSLLLHGKRRSGNEELKLQRSSSKPSYGKRREAKDLQCCQGETCMNTKTNLKRSSFFKYEFKF